MKRLPKDELKDLLEHWQGRYAVLAPTRTDHGDWLFDTYRPEAFDLTYGKTPLSPKSVPFPQSEVLFAVEAGRYRETIVSRKTLLFGIRACDLMGLRQAGSFMGREGGDPYFDAKLADATTVVMACAGPQNETCFCSAMRSGPVARQGFDLQFFETGDGFAVASGSRKGEEALASYAPLEDLDEARARETLAAFQGTAVAAVSGDAVQEAMARLEEERADETLWERLGEKCILCGGCAYVCPTCTCFNVFDRTTGPGQGGRLRVWDACLFGGFTREASGHNPRPTQALRLKRRHEHKLRHYQAADIQDALCGCIGCGRCSDFCPVHIGTLEVVRTILEAERLGNPRA